MGSQSFELTNCNEWTEWHLTPRGWEKGTEKQDYPAQVKQLEPPLDRVLTYRYHQNIPINSIWMQKSANEIWKCSDQKIVAELLQKFGDCPQNL